MKIATIIVLSISMFSCFNNKKDESCFSENNFEKVYQYLNNEITAQELSFYIHDEYEIHLFDENEIKIKQNGWTLAIIRKEKGIFALAKLKSDNEKQLMKTNKIFCQLVTEVDNWNKKQNSRTIGKAIKKQHYV